jgi:polysaccharide export outer membrane protein
MRRLNGQLVAKRSDAMNNRNSRISEAIGVRGRRGMVNILFLLALGLALSAQPGILRGQNPTPAVNPNALPSAPQTSPTAPEIVSDQILISPGDVLDIYVYDVPELSHTYPVSPSGVVSVPLLPDPVRAAGLTPDQFARSLEDSYRQAGRLRRPEIAVSIKQSAHTLSVTVDGAVRTPQILTVTGRIKLVDALTQCGGVTTEAGTTLTISRGTLGLRNLAAEGDPASPTLILDLKRVSDGSDPSSLTPLWPGDRVTVGMAGVYYVMGEVKTPGGYNLKTGRDELTVLRAIALAGDLTSVAKKSKAMIIRKDSKAPQGRDEIKLDLQSILVGKSPDPVLQADDILFVPGSNGKKALHTLENAPATIVGNAGASALILH